jgi:amino acid permease
VGSVVRDRRYSEDIHAIPAAAALDRKTDAQQLDEASKTLRERAFSPLTAGGIRQSVFTLVQTALGGGVLTISYMLRLSGCAVGTSLLFFCGFVAFAGMRILMCSAVNLQIFTFSGLLSKCLGTMSGMFLDVSLFFYGTGSCITYFIFLGDFVPDLVLYFGDLLGAFDQAHGAPHAQDIRTSCLIASLVIVIPLCLPKELSALRHVSPIALAGILYTAMVVFGRMCWRLYSQDPELDHVEIDLKAEDLTVGIFCKCFSMCIFAYNCHINVVPVAQELNNPGKRRIEKVTMRVVVVQLVLYMLLSWGGYISFGRDTPANIITAYGKRDPWITMSRVMLAITIAAAIPTSVNPTVRSLLNLCEACIPSLREEDPSAPGAQGKLQPLLSGVLVMPPEDRPPPWLREVMRKLFAVCSCILQCWVAVSVKNVASVIQVLGATVGTLMMMVVPVLLMHRACPELYGTAPKWGYTLLFGLAAALSVASLVLS